jgi:hypothetical protein
LRNNAALSAVLLGLCGLNHQRNEVPGQELADADIKALSQSLGCPSGRRFLYTSRLAVRNGVNEPPPRAARAALVFILPIQNDFVLGLVDPGMPLCGFTSPSLMAFVPA